MNFKNLSTFTFFFLSLLFISCSPKILPVAETRFSAFIQPFATDTLLPVPTLVFTDYVSQPVKLTEHPLEISEHFTGEEKYLVRAKTEKLFEKREEILIDFSRMAETSFCFPLPNARILSPYGKRRGRSHTGIDLKTFAGDTIRAAFDGIIRIAGVAKGYGNVVVIRHYNGMETVYGHNSRFLVKAGDKVKAGMPISLEGRTGRATTDHLHFETRMNGQPFDPNLVIDFKAEQLQNRCLVFTPAANGKIRIDQV